MSKFWSGLMFTVICCVVASVTVGFLFPSFPLWGHIIMGGAIGWFAPDVLSAITKEK